MPDLPNSFYILLAVWSVVCNIWLGLWIAQSVARRRGLILQPTAWGEGEPPRVAVVIPARNEAAAIDSCLEHLRGQAYPNWRGLVVDDRSEDATAEIVRGHVADDPRIQLLQVSQRPSGWMGKSYALWLGTRGLDADWFLFIDADCHLEPAAIATAVQHARARSCGMLTLWPRHRGGSFWEHLLIPLLGGVIALWFGTANRKDLTRGPGFANGQFILIQCDAYEAIGGHEAVSRCLIEDVPLGAHAKQQGLRCWAGGGAGLISVRMYDSLSAIRTGWERIYFGALRSRLKVLLSILWVLFGSLLPFVALPVAIGALFVGGRSVTPAYGAIALISLSHLMLIYMVSYRFWGWGGCDRRYLWLYPVSAVFVLWILTRCFITMSINRRICWRGTWYALSPKAVILD